MPLRKGADRKTTEANFRELGRGKTYRRTKKRHGKKRADRQRVAIVLSNQRKSKRHKRKSYRR
jgi:hypothetical protein